MSNRKPTSPSPAMPATEPMLAWWQQQWLQNASPLARMQLAWMESLAEAMQFEAQYFKAMAESGQRMAECVGGEDAPSTPAEVQECYQKLVKDVTDAQMKRMEKATQLSHEFRERIWEEL
ncbi:hypothetical protein MKP05_18085 [Halomonas sp. EGI 63088]|uniref:Phasin domain-containing protein n=1 Tax=Halomonas flagellata TaxID=2920385 RepID=A0ABS9RYS4_9GAMM|nr:hypothetical protein [Halomonas flagellata]MCH4565011.1 hypothetical protein [Halomonas flagellata]